jgi:hypothetical protein
MKSCNNKLALLVLKCFLFWPKQTYLLYIQYFYFSCQWCQGLGFAVKEREKKKYYFNRYYYTNSITLLCNIEFKQNYSIKIEF